MPDPFQPRFVDLVRNLTTTQGTGNFVLGAAVTGFASFSPAVLPGERFYYSAIGVDKPAEREVGRGTMQANGTIAREGIGGPLTNFTAGQKSVALIAAAEWYNSVQGTSGAGSGGIGGAATRAALAALTDFQLPVLLQEAGREGVFNFDSSNLSERVSADSTQGMYVAPASNPTGAAGAWVRRHSGPVDIRWFGGKADGALDGFNGPVLGAYGPTDNAVALNAALNFFSANEASSGADGIYRAGAHIHFPATDGVYDFQSAVEVRRTCKITGDGMGQAGGVGGSLLRWRPGMHGIILHYYNSNVTGLVSPTEYGAGGTIISGLHLIQHRVGNNSADDYHGIWAKCVCHIEKFGVTGWSGNGVHVRASAGGGGALEGNGNVFYIGHGFAYENEHGVHVDGADVNAGLIEALDLSGNRGYGYFGSDFLGNTIIACHADYNGLATIRGNNGVSSVCSYAGNWYAVKTGQAAGASTNAPSGTTAHNSYWHHLQTGGPDADRPAWTSGMTWREGGAYRSDSLNARNMFLNCYSEQNQGISAISRPAMVLGGLLGNGFQGDGISIGELLGAVDFHSPIQVNDPGGITTTGSLTSASIVRLTGDTVFPGVPANDVKIWRSPFDGLVLSGQGSNNDFAIYSSFGTNCVHIPAGTINPVFYGSVSINGTVTAANVSGTNSGDQTIALTGDVTGGGTGSIAATIGANKVTFAKFVAASAASIVGATAAGNFSELTPASARSVLGLAAIATSGSAADLTGTISVAQTPAFSGGDVTKASGSGIQTIASSAVTYPKMQNVSANALLLGRATAGAGVVEEVSLANGLAMAGTALGMGAITPASVVTAGAVASSGTAGNGYSTGAGGIVTQTPNKSSGVTLNKICGRVTMSNASLATAASISFTLTNSTIAATDLVLVNIASAGATNAYFITVDAVAAGSCRIHLRNISAGALAEALVLNFAVIKSVIA